MPDEVWTARFSGWLARSNTNGGQFWCSGEFTVYVHRVPASAPQDWLTGPAQTPGAWGAYREHLYYPERHGPYAFATAKTRADVMGLCGSHFKERISDWEKL